MTAKWEKTEANVGTLEVEVGSDRFAEALDVAFKKVVKRVTVPGFRKGKVPRRIFEARFGVESLYQEAVDFLLPRAYAEAVTETSIIPVAQPSVDVVQVEQGKAFVFKATVTVKPEVHLGNYKEIEVADKQFPVDDDAVEKELEAIRKSHAEIVVVEDGEVADGDSVNIDFKGTVDGEVFEGGEAENYQLEIGSGLFINGFETQLVGMKSGEERVVNVTFPEDYHVKSLAGKDAKFEVKLHDIKRKSIRPLDDELVQEISEFETVDQFVEDVKKQLIARADEAHKAYIEEQVLKAVVDGAEIDIPDVMVEHEVDHAVQNFGAQLQGQQIPLDEYMEFTGMTQDELRGKFHDSALDSVRTALVLEAIADAEQFNPTTEELDAEVHKLVESSGVAEDRVRQVLALRDPGFENLKIDLRNRKVVSFLVENGKVH